ncbi:hypothetical protein PABG_12197 [Paracoccidioides brasiliensis Pb03]|nr:hypothetical protein PABG_12197 [Paracoccidioides brasiliensis Pb03]
MPNFLSVPRISESANDLYSTHLRKAAQQFVPLKPPFPEAFLWHVFHSVATALLYCVHAHEEPYWKASWEEIIHKDVKPGNILLGAAPSHDSEELYSNCYLGDFGLAYTIPNEDVRAYKKGYSGKGSSEVYAVGEIGPKVDIYSLTLSIREAIDNALNIYATDEMTTLRKLPDGEKYLPYSPDLIKLCRAGRSNWTHKRLNIYSLWKATGEQACKWKAKVMENRRLAFQYRKSATMGWCCWMKRAREGHHEEEWRSQRGGDEWGWGDGSETKPSGNDEALADRNIAGLSTRRGGGGGLELDAASEGAEPRGNVSCWSG